MNHITFRYDFTQLDMRGSIFMVLLVILIAGCAPAAVETDRQTSPGNTEAGAEQSLATPTEPLLTPTNTPAAGRSSTSISIITPTPVEISNPADTPAPTGAPTAAATVTSGAVAAPLPTSMPEVEPVTGIIEQVELENNKALAQEGLRVYKEQYCGICHKLDTANTGGTFGPAQNQIGTIAGQRVQNPGYSGVATTAAEYIRESILDPQIYLVEGYEQSRHHMPAFTHLSEAEINALVALLLQQK